MVSESWDRASCRAPCRAWSFLGILSLPLSLHHPLRLVHAVSFLEKKKAGRKERKGKEGKKLVMVWVRGDGSLDHSSSNSSATSSRKPF